MIDFTPLHQVVPEKLTDFTDRATIPIAGKAKSRRLTERQ